jgi:hypothetical protein
VVDFLSLSVSFTVSSLTGSIMQITSFFPSQFQTEKGGRVCVDGGNPPPGGGPPPPPGGGPPPPPYHGRVCVDGGLGSTKARRNTLTRLVSLVCDTLGN